VVSGREWVDVVEMIAFYPILQFTGLVACVLADFKHGDDDYFDGNGCGVWHGL
jgi:hypothetical protein